MKVLSLGLIAEENAKRPPDLPPRHLFYQRPGVQHVEALQVASTVLVTRTPGGVGSKSRTLLRSASPLMARVLFIEDDRALTAALTMAFEEEGHEVITAFDGKEGLDRISRDKPDIVICDVALPKLDGFSLCKTVRQNNPQLPFMLLTARDGDIDHALGLSLGADDYVIKPVSARVLLARLQALLRRVALLSQPSNISQIVRVGRLELDRERLECRYDGIVIETTVTEIKLIEALIAKPGVVLSRSQLLTSSRGDNSIVTDRVIDTYVRRLRRKFELVDPSFVQLETVIGAGYRWKAA